MKSSEIKEPKEIRFSKTRKKINIFADFETFLDTNGYDLSGLDQDEFHSALVYKCTVKPWLLGYRAPAIKVKNGEFYIDESDYRNYWSIDLPHENFFRLIKNIYDLGYTPVIWFHNASYDLTSAIGTCFKRLDENINCYFYCRDNDKSFLRGAMESPKYGFKAMFGDTLLYKRISLGTVGAMLGFEKGEICYQMSNLYIKDGYVHYLNWRNWKNEVVHLRDCVEYVLRDVEILHRYFMYQEEEKDLTTIAVNGSRNRKINTMTQGLHAIKLADLYLNKVSNERYKNLFRFEIDDQEYQRQRISRCGGFTSLNKNVDSFRCEGEYKDWIITSFDCNSMYPSIIKGGLPCGEYYDEKPQEKSIEWVLIRCKDVYWGGVMEVCENTPIPMSKQGLKHKYIEFYIDRETLEFIKANMAEGGEITEIKSKWQIHSKLMGTFIDYLYDIRNKLREELKDCEKGSSEYMLKDTTQKGVKTVMNSLYGKLCQDKFPIITWYTHQGYMKTLRDNCTNNNLLSGVYIALKGRLELYKRIKAVLEKGFIFLYADTDSVKFAYPKDRVHEVEEIFGCDRDGLGNWKNEGYWHEFKNPKKKKKYMFINWDEPENSSITLSGVKDVFIHALKNGLVNNPNKTIEDLRFIFDKNNNVIFRNCKTKKYSTSDFDQPVLVDVDVSTNPNRRKEPNGECYLSDDGYVFKKL